MPRRQQQIAADKIVANQIFADSVNASSSFYAKTADYTLTAADNGATFNLDTASIIHTMPLVATLTAGWKVHFRKETAGLAGVDIAITTGDADFIGSVQQTTTPGILAPADTELLQLDAAVEGDFLDIVFNGTNFSISYWAKIDV